MTRPSDRNSSPPPGGEARRGGGEGSCNPLSQPLPLAGERRNQRRRRVILATVAVVLLPATAHALDMASLQFDQLYKSFGVRGYEFSDTLLALKGKPVTMRGYMAPPLKAMSRFFVLTSEPLALCPFCQSDADWPADIVVVYLERRGAMFGGGEPVMV